MISISNILQLNILEKIVSISHYISMNTTLFLRWTIYRFPVQRAMFTKTQQILLITPFVSIPHFPTRLIQQSHVFVSHQS